MAFTAPAEARGRFALKGLRAMHPETTILKLSLWDFQ